MWSMILAGYFKFGASVKRNKKRKNNKIALIYLISLEQKL